MNRKVPWRGARAQEDFRQKQVERFTSPQRTAQDHMLKRNSAVVRLLCYLSMLRNAGAVSGPRVDAVRARFQTTSGSKALGEEAAHALPRQVLLDGREPSSLLVEDKPLPRRAQEDIRFQFADVSVWSRTFNVADSAAELHGLVDALVGSCQRIVNEPRLGTERKVEIRRGKGMSFGDVVEVSIWPIARARVRQAFHTVWLPLAEKAYQKASDAIAESRSCLSRHDDPREVLYVLEHYLKNHRVEPSALLEAQMDELELIFNMDEALAKEKGLL